MSTVLTLVFADTDCEVYDANCPSCGYALAWSYDTPPIPMVLHRWHSDERVLTECPACDEPLPEGDLR